MLASSVP